MKMAKRITRPINAQAGGMYTGSMVMTHYTNIRPRSVKKMINRLHDKCDSFLLKGGNSLMWPLSGVEIVRTGHRSLVVCQATKVAKNVAPTLASMLEGGYTHVYNHLNDEWDDVRIHFK